MDPAVLYLVLAAAVLHASWNALVKSGDSPWIRLALANCVGTIFAVALLPLVDFPAAEVWPFILGSVAVHQVYFVFVALQYRFGDLSHVYPIARGVAPILVALGAFVFAGETLSGWGVIAIVVICGSVLSLAFGGRRAKDRRAVFLALCTGTTIACYTVIDGLGGRTADNVFGYIVYLFLLDALPFGLLVIFLRRRTLIPDVKANWKTGSLGGLFSFLAYALVIWAMTLSPMTYVSALRETSVIIAALIGTRLMHEPFGVRRIAAAAGVATGVILLQITRGA